MLRNARKENKVLKAFKFRLYPNKTTEEKLQWVLDRCRELYNAALQERKEAWKYAGKSINYYDQQNDLPAIKEICPEYKEIGAHVLQDVLRRLDKAFQTFFRRIRSGQTPGYPRFQGKNRYDSFTYPDEKGWKLTIEEQGHKLKGRIHLTKIGTLKVNLHRPVAGKVKTCTIKREGSHWYVVFAVEMGLTPHLAYSDELVGVDLGVMRLATLSTGDTIENPRHYRRAEQKLAQKQKSLSRKKRRSKRRKKAAKLVGKLHRKVANQRKDFLHKQSRALVDAYDTIAFEDLSPSNLSRRPKPKQDEETGAYLPNGAAAKGGLNKSIQDAGWGQFVQYCRYKAEEAGRYVLFVDPKYTSQICSGCGTVRKKDLSERWHSCDCGTELDRDHNAAINIARLGSNLQRTRLCEAPAERQRVLHGISLGSD